MYKPYQRLDYYLKKNDPSMYVRARFIVLLYGEESIDIPDGVYIDSDNFFVKTFYVKGEASGEPYEFKGEYKIRFIDKVKIESDIDNAIELLKEEVKFRLEGRKFTVRTLIKKKIDISTANPTDPGHIFLCDPSPTPCSGDEEGEVTNETGEDDTIDDERDIEG